MLFRLRISIENIPYVRIGARFLGILPKDMRWVVSEYFRIGSTGAEIGVFKGNFSEKILKHVKPKKLHLIDPWEYQSLEIYSQSQYGGIKGKNQSNMDQIYHSVIKKFSKEIKAGQVEIHRKYSHKAFKEFPDHYFDWIYIDGNHHYEFVQKDLNLYYDKVKKGGYITGDDYVVGAWWKDGVKKAVDEFIVMKNLEIILFLNGQFILRKE